MFSAVAGDNFDGKEVIATMVKTAKGRMNITYRDHADGFEIQAGDFRSSAEALAFKRGFGPQGNGDDGLDEVMSQAFGSYC